MEGLVADVALVCLLSGVGEPVVLVVALLVEPLPAELAVVRLEPVVDPHVRVQRGAPGWLFSDVVKFRVRNFYNLSNF